MRAEEMAGAPAGARRRVLSRDPPIAEAAEGAFDQLVTPASQRFVRCHFPVPEPRADHALELCGALAQPLRLTMEELRALPQTTHTVVTECAGNGRDSFSRPVRGEPWGSGAVSVAQWTGVPLQLVLERAALRDTAVELVFTGADSGRYQRSLPLEAANDPAVLLALQMNGAPIPLEFGGPLRLIVPGWYGMASVKWLSRIEAVETPFQGEFQTGKYVYSPGVPVTTLRVKSMFTSIPALRAGWPARLAGLAWGADRIASVIIFAGGAWLPARLMGPLLPFAWRRFEVEWTPPVAGEYELRCGATTLSGETQPATPLWNEGGYGANGIQRLTVTAD